MSVTVLHPDRGAQQRFHLHRGGLVGLYEYEQETFEFERGRLLLRGPNGAGKSKALELLLPLLLDGELRSERLDPFGGRGRSMRWNLTGGDETRAPAAGFSWLELRAVDEQGTERFVTLVLMVRANRGESGVHSWFAVLQAHRQEGGELVGPRIGINASLTHEHHPISRAAFSELAGELIETASVFRERVNALLFGLPQDRYEALIRLLLSLRKPQLSQTLDPDELSARLTEALPELERDAVVRVSSRLDQLDRLRDEAKQLREVREAVGAFARTYRDWARAALRERGAALLEAAAELQRRRDAVASLESQLAGARERRGELAQRSEALERERAAALAAARELRASEGWQAAERLEELRRLAQRAQAAAAAARDELERARTGASELARAAEQARAALAEQQAAVRSLLEACARRAAAAGVRAHAAAVQGLAEERRNLDAVAGLLERLAGERLAALDRLVELAARLAACEAALESARERFERAEGEQRRRQAERAQEAQRLEQVRAALLEALEGWLEGLQELALGDADTEELADRLARAGEPGAPRAGALVSERAAAAEDELRAAAAEVIAARRALAAAREPLEDERRRLSEHQDPLPEPLPFRADSRESRPGAPLWALVDFADSLGDGERAGLEGALEGAGLLDAWVMPDGRLLDADDALLLADTAARAPSPTLADALVPVSDAPVPAAVVAAVLARVALAAGEQAPSGGAAVALDGRFRLGPLCGRHRVAQARFIGAAARAANRARRLAELHERLTELEREDERLVGEARQLDERRARLRAELSSLPDDTPAIRAHDGLVRAQAEERRAAERTAAEQRVMEQRAGERDEARDLALAHAREHELPAPGEPSAHAALREELHAYRLAVGELLGAERLHRERHAAAAHAEHQAEQAALAQSAADAQRAEREREAGERAAAHREALAAEGASVEQLRGRLQRLEDEAERAERERSGARAEELQLAQQEARAESESRHARADVEHAGRTLAAAHERVARLGELGAWALALGERAPQDEGAPQDERAPDDRARAGEWALARTLAALRAVPREALATRRAFETLIADVDREADELRHRLSASAEFEVIRERVVEDAELTRVQIRHGGRAQGIVELERWLEDELAGRERLIAEEDRRLFESFLVGGLADALRERIGGARALVASMNQALAGCETSSGMGIELEWRAREHEDPGLREAVALLGRDIALLADDGRERLVEFLRGRIEEARRSLEQGSSTEHVMAALDYRAWHEFRVIQLLEGRHEVLTRRRHQQGSGGEKSVALHLPLFAAAAAQFSAAAPHAPRLILLDEAFAGIDERMRAQLLGLLERFDLDYVLTSHELWGCYPECSALGIYHLHREPGIPGVASAHFRWDGSRRIEVAEEEVAA